MMLAPSAVWIVCELSQFRPIFAVFQDVWTLVDVLGHKSLACEEKSGV